MRGKDRPVFCLQSADKYDRVSPCSSPLGGVTALPQGYKRWGDLQGGRGRLQGSRGFLSGRTLKKAPQRRFHLSKQARSSGTKCRSFPKLVFRWALPGHLTLGTGLPQQPPNSPQAFDGPPPTFIPGKDLHTPSFDHRLS